MLENAVVECPHCASNLVVTAMRFQSERLCVFCLCSDCRRDCICRSTGDESGRCGPNTYKFAEPVNRSSDPMSRIVIRSISADSRICDLIEGLSQREGFEIESFDSAEAFLRRSDLFEAGCTIIDDHRGGRDAAHVLGELRRMRCHIPVLIVNQDRDLRSAVQGFQNGAFDVLVKPCSNIEIAAALKRAICCDLRQCACDHRPRESDRRAIE